MVGIVEAQQVRHFAYAQTFHQEILGLVNHDYYKTERGYHSRSGNSNDGWNIIGTMSFMNQPILDMAREIKTPVLLIHGEKAHSRYFSEGAFEAMTGIKPKPGKSTVRGNKELLIIPGAVHTDLYDDKAGVIPYDRIETFFKENLKKD